MIRRYLPVALLLAGCSDSPAAPSSPPPALRDVERASEDLVAATFGDFPARTPDWSRASTLLAALHTAWTSSRSTPGLPAASVARIDGALPAVDAAVSAQNQQDAANAANTIAAETPALFDVFHPEVPLAVAQLDAVMEQLALDAHFGNWNGAAADLQTLEQHWSAVRNEVQTRAPTCTRVTGAMTIPVDFDNALMALSTAVGMNSAMTAEMGAETGLDDIDVLELLYRCPAGSGAPAHGLGSRCHANSDCDAGQVCDAANAGGTCAPDPARAAIGTPCATTAECGSDRRSACATASGDGFPGGYCSMEPCDDIQVCPPGATCVALGPETPSCFKTCASDADCRTAEGYVCQLFVVTPPDGFGPSDHACGFKCTRDPDCKAPLLCDVASGKCHR
jgi:hypothetical protein